MSIMNAVKGRVSFDLNKALEFAHGHSELELRRELRKRLIPIIDKLLDETVEEVAASLLTHLEVYYNVHKGATDIYFTVKDNPTAKLVLKEPEGQTPSE